MTQLPLPPIPKLGSCTPRLRERHNPDLGYSYGIKPRTHGDSYRVIICHDVIAVPALAWSDSGYSQSWVLDRGWLENRLHDPRHALNSNLHDWQREDLIEVIIRAQTIHVERFFPA